MMPRTKAPAIRSKKKLPIHPLRVDRSSYDDSTVNLVAALPENTAPCIGFRNGGRVSASVHCIWSVPSAAFAEPLGFLSGESAGFRVGGKHVVDLSHRRSRHASENAFNHGGDAWKGQAPLKKCSDGYFIGSIQSAGQRTALAKSGF